MSGTDTLRVGEKMSEIQEINDQNYRKFVNGKGLRGLKVGAKWCSPCRDLEKVLPRIAKAQPSITWGKADSQESPKLCKKYKVEGIPLILIFRNGKRIGRSEGYDTYKEIVLWLVKVCK